MDLKNHSPFLNLIYQTSISTAKPVAIIGWFVSLKQFLMIRSINLKGKDIQISIRNKSKKENIRKKKGDRNKGNQVKFRRKKKNK